MNVKKVKKFPIFWTFLKKDGVATIHQVRFSKLETIARIKRYKRDELDEIDVHNATFEIAGTPTECCCALNKPNGFDLSNVFSTFEDAVNAVQNPTNICPHFKRVLAGEGKYHISKRNILHRSEWTWDKYVPSNMLIHEDGMDIHLCGYYWNGVKTRMQEVDYTINQRISEFPIFDMVSQQFLGTPTKQYYKTKEECDGANCLQVFEFED